MNDKSFGKYEVASSDDEQVTDCSSGVHISTFISEKDRNVSFHMSDVSSNDGGVGIYGRDIDNISISSYNPDHNHSDHNPNHTSYDDVDSIKERPTRNQYYLEEDQIDQPDDDEDEGSESLEWRQTNHHKSGKFGGKNQSQIINRDKKNGKNKRHGKEKTKLVIDEALKVLSLSLSVCVCVCV